MRNSAWLTYLCKTFGQALGFFAPVFILGILVFTLPVWAAAPSCNAVFMPDWYAGESLPTTVASWSNNHYKMSLADNLRALSAGNQLMDQMHDDLGERSLLLPNGGLCGSTCGTAVLEGALAYSGVDPQLFAKNAGTIIHKMVETVYAQAGKDARTGVTLRDLKNALDEVSSEWSEFFTLETTLQESISTRNPYQPPTSPDTIQIISVGGNVEKRWERGMQNIYHAMIVLGRNQKDNNYLDMIDPNYPDKIEENLLLPEKEHRYADPYAWDFWNFWRHRRYNYGSSNGRIYSCITITVKRKTSGVRTKEFLQKIYKSFAPSH